MAPTKVRGRLLSRPNMAAAKASITSRVRALALMAEPWIGVMRMPARAARKAPPAHEMVARRSGRPPLSWSRSGSSTTARMATPERVRRNSRAMPPAMAMASTKAMISCQVMLTPAMRTEALAPKNLRKSRGVRGVGFQIQVARARKPSITPTGTMILVTSEVPRRFFMITW